jgi:hypothetical protein
VLESGDPFLGLGRAIADDDVRVHREEALELAGVVHGADADRHAGVVQRIDEIGGEDETFERDPVDASVQNPLHQCFGCIVGPQDEPGRDLVFDRDLDNRG